MDLRELREALHPTTGEPRVVIHYEGCGLIGQGPFLEVWLLRRGFALLGRTDGEELARSDRPYSWRALATLLRTVVGTGECQEALSAHRVEGEAGLRAAAVEAVLVGQHRLADFLVAQSDASLAALEAALPDAAAEVPRQRALRPLAAMSGRLEGLGLPADVGILEGRLFGSTSERPPLRAFAARLRELNRGCLRTNEQRAAFAEAQRRLALRPYAAVIECFVTAWDRAHRQTRIAGWGNDARKGAVRRYMEEYALAHGELPTGVRCVPWRFMGPEPQPPLSVDFGDSRAGSRA